MPGGSMVNSPYGSVMRKSFPDGTVFGKHMQAERLLPVWGARLCIFWRQQPDRVVGSICPFFQGIEHSVELTWNQALNESLSIQPTFQYIRNGNGSFTVLSARIYYSF